MGPDGDLYIGVGDGGSGGDPNGNGQNTNVLLAKILRINPTPSGNLQYTIPADNPFAGQTGKRGEIWMYGLRNPWRFSFDKSTGEMWIGDVGQDLYEEVDYATPGQKGTNWGWNLREGLHPYNGGAEPPGAEDPIIEARAQRRLLRDHRRLRVSRLRDREPQRRVRVRRQLPHRARRRGVQQRAGNPAPRPRCQREQPHDVR